MTKKQVTFSRFLEFLNTDGSIELERDWGACPQAFDSWENKVDYVQRQFDNHLSMLGSAGKEDLERIKEFCACASTLVEKIGVVDYMKLLAQLPNDICGPITKPLGITFATLDKKKTGPRYKDGKRRGILAKPKEIPGRDTPELRKLRIIAGQQESKMNRLLPRQERKIPDSILRVPKNDSNLPPVIDLTSIDDANLFGKTYDDARTPQEWSFDEDFLEEREPVSSEERESAPIYPPKLRPSPTPDQSLRVRHPSPRQDPPSAMDMLSKQPDVKEGCISANGQRKPDPLADYCSRVSDAGEGLKVHSPRYRHVPSCETRRAAHSE